MRKTLLCGVLAAVFALPALAADKAAFSVNGVAVPQARLDAMVQQMQQQGQADSPQLRSAMREQLVLMEILRQEAIKRGMDKSADFRAEVETFTARALANLVVRDWMRTHPISDADLRAEFAKLQTQVGRKEYRARHVLVDSEAEAQTVLADLKKGKAFAQIAQAQSKDTGSKAKGGELDWASADTYVPEFSQALTKLQAGQVAAAPVKTQFGWHVIKLIDSREVTPPKFDEVKEQLAVQVRRDRVQAEIEKRVAGAKVEKTEGLSPDLLNKTDILGE